MNVTHRRLSMCTNAHQTERRISIISRGGNTPEPRQSGGVPNPLPRTLGSRSSRFWYQKYGHLNLNSVSEETKKAESPSL